MERGGEEGDRYGTLRGREGEGGGSGGEGGGGRGMVWREGGR
jgi:hypothetical protein